ncbi:SRPBCC family protein [Flavobacteriaceae bacterium 14752]|uniref:SRPBCC family protein n=1 Tax=Mesohalobacter salilacus TaxID=2491711 RepID=UPI000F63D278|nr:SRPBCC family protein [Flavobacteriaceae bacterium 14752]
MIYDTEIIINKPIDEVMELFKNPDHLKSWQRGLKSTKLLKGKSGQLGAKRKLNINLEGRDIEMIETITKCDLPKHWYARYTSKGLVSYQKKYFERLEDNKTYWKTTSRFEFHGYMRIVGQLLPGIFKRRSKTVMQDFKNFAENRKNVNLS